MKKQIFSKMLCAAVLGMCCLNGFAQGETLQTVVNRGNVANTSIQLDGGYVNANTTKLFIQNPLGKNWAWSAGANGITEEGFHLYNWTQQPGTPLLTMSNNGFLGIGTYLPAARLHVQGTAVIWNPDATSYNENLRLPSANSGYAAVALGAGHEATGTIAGQWTLIKWPAAQGSKFSIRHQDDDHMTILANGNIGVGHILPPEKFSVNGKILATEVKVATVSNWPDYVFQPGYALMNLAETESFISKNGHLPEVPAAKVVEAEGIQLAEMNKILLKKVEELTLHLINQEKKLAAQAEAQNTAAEMIGTLLRRIEKLEKTEIK